MERYAIFSDLSGVTPDPDGPYSRREALERLVAYLEADRRRLAIKLGSARRALTLQRRKEVLGS